MYRVPPLIEEWRRVSDYIPYVKPYYLVSNYGKVYSEFSMCNMNLTNVGRGYEKIKLACINGFQDFLIHRLVMMCFNPIENPESYQVNHMLGIKTINETCVLEWCNNSENGLHSYRMGLRKQGEEHDWAKLDNNTVHKICQALQERMNYKDVCNFAGIGYDEKMKDIISSIKNKKIWKSISCLYNIPESSRNDQLFSDNEAHTICKYMETNMNNKEILKNMGFDINNQDKNKKGSLYRTLNRIRSKDRYTHISKDYNF